MSKRTIINADEELVIKGKLTIEGNVTQIETTQQVTNLEGNVFTINSDGSNTSSVIALNSNGTVATFTFDSANGSIVVNTPLNFGSQNISTSGNVIGAYFIGNGSGLTGLSTTIVTEGTNLYFTPARARGNISVTDAGGDGSLAYNSGTGVITYTGPNQAEANARIDARLSGGTGITYTSGTIAVDNTIVRTTGNQTIAGEKTFTGQLNLTANIIPTTSNTYSIGNTNFHINEIYANVLHAEILDLGDADLSDIHATFYAGTPTGNIVSADTSTAGGLIYNHKTTGQANAGGYYRVNAGTGLEIDGNGILQINNTVITTVGGQTINGNLTLTGNLNVVNIDSLTQTDSVVNDKVLYLNVGGGTSPNNSRVSVEKSAANVYLEYNSRWKFTNDGANVNNMLLFTDFSAGNGLSYNNTGGYAVVAGDGISVGSNVAVDSSVVRTSGNQTIAGIKNFTGELVIPSSFPTQNNTIYINAGNTAVFANVNGAHVQLTADSDVGQVEDVGATGIDIYAGFRTVTVGNSNVVYHGIRSIEGGTYTAASVASNVITIDGNINAIRGSLSAANVSGYGGISYSSANGVFSYFGVTDAQIRGLFSASGLLSYNASIGAFTTSADNYSSWTVQTDSGIGAADSITSGEKLTIQSGTGISVTNTGNVITITNSSTADITGVAAGAGLTGGGNSGDVTLNIGAGAGITVNADNIALTSGVVTAAAQGGGISAITVDTYGRVTSVTSNAGYTTNTGNVTSVSGGNGLTGTVTTSGSLDVGAGAGITVNADNVAINVAYVRGQFSAAGDLSYNATSGIFSFTNDAGDIESVTAGDGLTGGGVSGAVTLNIGAGPGITVNADNVALTSGIVTTGAKTYGSANEVPAITVDTYGRVTSVSNTSISITASQVSNFTSAANTAIDARLVGGSGLTYSSGTFAVGAGSYILVGTDDISVNASTTATASTIAARDASGNITANVFVGTATSARYADLAENYLADGDYLPGTVLVFGGDAEVTAAITYSSTRIAGVVTTQPAHVMNSHLVGDNVACIALRGRVPVKVTGIVRKGDVLVSAGEGLVGYAIAALYPHDVPAAAMVGKAIGDKFDTGPGVIEALI